MAEQAQSIARPRRRIRPETSAWLMLFGFFLLFCAIVAGIGYGGWRYYNLATRPAEALLRVHVNTGVTFQAHGDLRPVSLERARNPCPDSDNICKALSAGDRVKTRPEAGYGPVASIKLPDATQIDLWAHPTGTEVMLDHYLVSRWTNRRQDVLLRQEAGYARYDVADGQPYAEVSYTVQITDGMQVHLTPGGSYSVNVPRDQPGHPRARTDSGELLLVEVAVRSGRAEVWSAGQQLTLSAGQKAQVSRVGSISGPLPARWELIRDGQFTQFATQTYPDDIPSWWRNWDRTAPDLTPAEQNGVFDVVEGCRPEKPDFCTAADQVNIGRFLREGNQQKSFATGISQTLDLDVSEYRSLRLSAWARVIYQSVPQAGIAGSECPITIQFIYKQKSPTDGEQRRYFCVYADEANTTIEKGESEFIYQSIPRSQWYHLTYELRDVPSLDTAYYLQTVRIYANGHDYVSQIYDISLIGTQ